MGSVCSRHTCKKVRVPCSTPPNSLKFMFIAQPKSASFLSFSFPLSLFFSLLHTHWKSVCTPYPYQSWLKQVVVIHQLFKIWLRLWQDVVNECNQFVSKSHYLGNSLSKMLPQNTGISKKITHHSCITKLDRTIKNIFRLIHFYYSP